MRGDSFGRGFVFNDTKPRPKLCAIADMVMLINLLLTYFCSCTEDEDVVDRSELLSHLGREERDTVKGATT